MDQAAFLRIAICFLIANTFVDSQPTLGDLGAIMLVVGCTAVAAIWHVVARGESGG